MEFELVGTVGTLTTATRGPDGPGEVLVRVRGGSETLLAYSDDPIARGTSVLIVDVRGARGVTVVRMDESATPHLPLT